MLSPSDLAVELYARGLTGTREEAWVIVKEQPEEAIRLLAPYHHETASVAEWGGMGTGNEAPKKKDKPC